MAFTSIIDSFILKYKSADTEIRKTDIRFQRKQAVAGYFSKLESRLFQGWIGNVEALGTERDGEAYVAIKLRGTDIRIKTWNNSFSDIGTHTMISRSDGLYPSLMQIQTGDEVTVSGIFLPADSEQDCVKEASLTEEGSMTEPEFIVKFSQISKGAQSSQESNAAQPVTLGEALTPAVSQQPSPSAVVERVAPTPSVAQHDQPYAATCEVVNSEGLSCVIESHSTTTGASSGEAWKITILNSSYKPAVFTARIELQDDAGGIVKTSSWGDLSVGGYGRYNFTGRLEHENSVKFARLVAKLEANSK